MGECIPLNLSDYSYLHIYRYLLYRLLRSVRGYEFFPVGNVMTWRDFEAKERRQRLILAGGVVPVIGTCA